MDEKKTVIHEAGHAVMAHRLAPGFSIQIALLPKEAGSRGQLTFENPHDDEIEVLVDCAGYAAVLAAGYSEDEAFEGAEEDLGKADRKLRPHQSRSTVTADDDGLLRRAMDHAADIMRRPENVKAVARIADELLEARSLDCLRLPMLLQVLDGEITEEEYSESVESRRRERREWAERMLKRRGRSLEDLASTKEKT